ncbi:MAG: ribose-phosphate pyrophosphokinase [Candidatus Diapherotrites archaeon]|nr:ribose-phosphate pyrophosphokinase [Candidatus Diapherotrites archaeon]
MENFDLVLFSGSANPKLTEGIAEHLGIALGKIRIERFADNETYVQFLENIRGKDVFLVQPTCNPANENIMELLIMIDAAKRASAGRITAVMPFYGYRRQDRKTESREPITAKLVADLLTAAGADRVAVIDLHSGQVQGFFDIPLDNLTAEPLILNYLRSKKLPSLTVVAPDVGSAKGARDFARLLDAEMAVISKKRGVHDEVETVSLIGEVKGRNIAIIDDEISTGGTIVNAAKILKENGAGDIYVAVTHAILAGNAIEKLNSAPIKELIVTDTIPIASERAIGKIRVLSVSEILAKAIGNIHENKSVSELFEARGIKK